MEGIINEKKDGKAHGRQKEEEKESEKNYEIKKKE
jgi:hypothetical protein